MLLMLVFHNEWMLNCETNIIIIPWSVASGVSCTRCTANTCWEEKKKRNYFFPFQCRTLEGMDSKQGDYSVEKKNCEIFLRGLHQPFVLVVQYFTEKKKEKFFRTDFAIWCGLLLSDVILSLLTRGESKLNKKIPKCVLRLTFSGMIFASVFSYGDRHYSPTGDHVFGNWNMLAVACPRRNVPAPYWHHDIKMMKIHEVEGHDWQNPSCHENWSTVNGFQATLFLKFAPVSMKIQNSVREVAWEKNQMPWTTTRFIDWHIWFLSIGHIVKKNTLHDITRTQRGVWWSQQNDSKNLSREGIIPRFL